MATFYLDYEGGSDAADGTSFANRWKTITSGATAARIAPGDTIRIMGSPAPTSLGINATWTNKSATITLASALNVLITNCDTAWTASANVTCTANTSTYRTSTGSASAAIASGFTTGKIAYFDLGSNQDYSGYQGITFWIHCTTGTIAASTIDLRLCSDATGDTAVDTFTIPAISQSGQWVPVYLDKGSALGSAIRSVSLSASSDPGTVTILLDNISTVKAAGNDALTLKSLVGKNTAGEYWWAIRQINGTALTIDTSPNVSPVSTVSRGYYGTTETVTTYKRETIATDLVAVNTSAVQVVQDSGTAGNLITFSGGWDRTAMTTQNLETWFDGRSGFGVGLHSNDLNYLRFESIFCVRYYYGVYISGDNDNHHKLYAGHCNIGVNFFGPGNLTIDEAHSWGGWGSAFLGLNGSVFTANVVKGVSCAAVSNTNMWSLVTIGGGWSIGSLTLCNGGANGLSYSTNVDETPSPCYINTLTVSDNNSHGFYASECRHWYIGDLLANGNGIAGINLIDVRSKLRIKSATLTNNTSYGINLPSPGLSSGADIVIGSLTTSGNGSAAVNCSVLYGTLTVLKSSMGETTKLTGTGISYGTGRLTFQNYNGTSGDHRTYGQGFSSGVGVYEIFSESTVRHTASGLAWKLSPKHAQVHSTNPIILQVGQINLAASITKTISLWVRRTNTGITAKLVVRGGQLDGITTDQVATASAAQDTWEQLSVNVTPSVAGVIEVEVQVYGGTTYSVYVDDLGVN